jgi:hypothetical protein
MRRCKNCSQTKTTSPHSESNQGHFDVCVHHYSRMLYQLSYGEFSAARAARCQNRSPDTYMFCVFFQKSPQRWFLFFLAHCITVAASRQQVSSLAQNSFTIIVPLPHIPRRTATFSSRQTKNTKMAHHFRSCSWSIIWPGMTPCIDTSDFLAFA